MDTIARFLGSVVRTIIAVALILVDVMCIINFFSWKPKPEDNFMVCFILVMASSAIFFMALLFGIYLISPIFWKWLKHRMDKTDWAEYVIDAYEMKSKYIW